MAALDVLLLVALLQQSQTTLEKPDVLIVVGVAGEPHYESQFKTWSRRWFDAAEQANASVIQIGESEQSEKTDAQQLTDAISRLAKTGNDPVWIVLIGHGSFDSRIAKFNLRGPDISAQELKESLDPIERAVVLFNCSSSSGPFINALSGPNRVIVTATRSGDEMNFARFGDGLSVAVTDPSADLDKDGQISVLEMFLSASNRTQQFYREQSRLATEHALLDDNGDSLGTPADWFRGVRAVRSAKDGATLDGTRAHQIHLLPSEREQKIPLELRVERDEIEREIATLRQEKTELSEDDYYGRLEVLMVKLARIYQQTEEDERHLGTD